MELPDQFKDFNYIIEVIRHFIFPDYLLTKKEQIKWYCLHVFLEKVWVNKFIKSDNELYKDLDDGFDLKTCTWINYRTGLSKELTDQDAFILLSNAKKVLIEKTLIKTLELLSKQSKEVENMFKIKIYPLDLTRILEGCSFKFFKEFNHLFFLNKSFVCNNDRVKPNNFSSLLSPSLLDELQCCIHPNIIIGNEDNDKKIEINKTLFARHCAFNQFIVESGEKVNQVIVPFSFGERVSFVMTSCLINGEFYNYRFNQLTEIVFK